MSGSTAARPTGVTILAVLAAIGGILGLLGGVALLGLGGIAAGATGNAAFFGLGAFAGIISVAIAIASLAFAYGAWMLQPWAWSLGVVLQLVSLVWAVLLIVSGGEIFSQGISIVIAGIILYYLNQPHVKAAFGRA
jgi:hypothetical protein